MIIDFDKVRNKIEEIGKDKIYDHTEGYSIVEMTSILYNSFDEESIVSFKKADAETYKKIPLLNLIKHLFNIIKKNETTKLTIKGNLRPKLVTDIYAQGFIKDEFAELFNTKNLKEDHCLVINLAKNLLLISGFIKKRHNILSLTKLGKKENSDYDFLKRIFEMFVHKFNWGYYDAYQQSIIGQIGACFTLILLDKYGNNKQLDSFYGEKYFKALPIFVEEAVYYEILRETDKFQPCYTVRTFDRFLDLFGLINIEKDFSGKNIFPKLYISKSKLFDKLIEITPPQQL